MILAWLCRFNSAKTDRHYYNNSEPSKKWAFKKHLKTYFFQNAYN